jgi:glutamate N-acetyltransferase/amino-acid N-acetyltransferase
MSPAPARSPFAPAELPELPPVRGVRLATGAAGIRYQGRTDLLLIELADSTAAAGALTRSATAAAPVGWCRTVLEQGRARAVVVNAGNANAFTGSAGDRAVERTAVAAGALLGCPADQVLVASTGVIGEPLPAEKIESALPHLADRLEAAAWRQAADAIMTTDTFPKLAGRRLLIDGVEVVINGIAKGAGMIAPDMATSMATLLAFVATDAAIAPSALQALVAPAVEQSFNAMTIDGDTSTNDTLLVFATSGARHRPIADATDPRAADFAAALTEVLIELAQQIAKDGEGASKFVTIRVSGAETDLSARRIGLTIANSPLVKTAIAGEDANWGRIIAAVGRSGERIEPARLRLRIGGVLVAADGGPAAGYDEAPVVAHIKGREIAIDLDLGLGRGAATVWTCDLTHGYIDINAAYRS